MLPNEALASILIILPYLLTPSLRPSSTVDITKPSHRISGIIDLTHAVLEENITESLTSNTWAGDTLCAGSLTAMTLLCIGGWSKWEAMRKSNNKMRESLGNAGDTEKSTFIQPSTWVYKQMAARALSVGLPFFSAMTIGGGRTGVLMLVAYASKLDLGSNKNSGSSPQGGWLQLLTKNRWTLASIGLSFFSDLVGFASATGVADAIAGYLAICLSIFIFNPPFPPETPAVNPASVDMPGSAKSTSAVPSTPWNAPPSAAVVISQPIAASPLIRTDRDTNLTIVTGCVLGLIVGVFSLFTSASGSVAFSFIRVVVTGAIMAASLVSVAPSALRTHYKLGVVLGSVLAAIASSELSLSIFSVQALMSGLHYGGLFFDNKVSPHSHHDHVSHGHSSHGHSHGHGHEHHHHHEQKQSAFTKYIVHSVEHWPLLHSILIEKDSRRIFYFMWYVICSTSLRLY